MKLKRVMALALAAARVASVAGCAKVKSISNDDFNTLASSSSIISLYLSRSNEAGTP